jgi:hypothetical protein
MLLAAQRIAQAVAAEYVAGGGRVHAYTQELTPERLASPEGALGPLIWLTGDFFRGAMVPFSIATYERYDDALAGYRPREVLVREDQKESSSLTILAFADFLRKELLDLEKTREVDLTPVCDNFRMWCELNYPAEPKTLRDTLGREPGAVSATLAVDRGGERSPE